MSPFAKEKRKHMDKNLYGQKRSSQQEHRIAIPYSCNPYRLGNDLKDEGSNKYMPLYKPLC